MFRILLLATLIAVSGCGSHESSGNDAAGPENDTTTHPLMLDDASKLPGCVSEREGWLVYLKAEAKFQVCTIGLWTDAPIQGAAGEKGEKGDTGAAGEKGADGAAAPKGILEVYNCPASIDFESGDPNVEVKGQNAYVYKMADDTWQLSCIDRKVDATLGYIDSSYDGAIWPITESNPSCVAFYVNGTFKSATTQMIWKLNGTSQTNTVDCSKL